MLTVRPLSARASPPDPAPDRPKSEDQCNSKRVPCFPTTHRGWCRWPQRGRDQYRGASERGCLRKTRWSKQWGSRSSALATGGLAI